MNEIITKPDLKKGTEDNNIVVELKNIKKSFSINSNTINVLNGINLQIQRGDFAAIVGKSGSGKSTLLNMITGIDCPSSGEIFVKNLRIDNLSENKAARWRGRNIGIVFQFFQLMPTLTVLENIILPMDFCNTYKHSIRKDIAINLLKKVGIEKQANKLPSTLSGGEQQRAALARALANNPEIIVADEPTGNLDTQTANDMYKIFKELNTEGKTLIIVSHDKDVSSIAKKTIVIKDGIII